MYDLIIIGGGPGGITAGIYAARQGLKTLLITKDFGGQIVKKTVAIENYPGFEEAPGLELIEKFEKHLKKQEITIEKDQVSLIEKTDGSFFVLTATKDKFEAKSVIIASGADPKHLGVPGEEEFTGKGVSYCPVCDGLLFSGKTVAVVGGGNSGFETALFLVNIAKKIYILEYGPEIKADKKNQYIASKSGKIEIITNAGVKKIKGDKFVKSIAYEDKSSGKEKILPLEGVFVEIGYQPSTSFVKDLVDFNENGEIEVDLKNYQTKTPGLFAVGDVNTGAFKQIIIACGEGATAALSAFNYLKKHE